MTFFLSAPSFSASRCRQAAALACSISLIFFTACATTTVNPRALLQVPAPPPGAPPAQQIVMEPIKLQVTPNSEGREVEILDPGGLFERAGQLLAQKQLRQARQLYEKLLAHFPTSRYASPALYNSGLASEWLGEFDQASLFYRELIGRFGSSKEAVDAGFRLGGCYAELGKWRESAATFSEVLSSGKLSASDRIEALTRRGLAYVRLGELQESKIAFKQAVDYHKEIEALERLDTDFFLAMAHYYLAAIPHLEFRKLEVDASGRLAETLDEKARLLLLAQAYYISAIKVKNPYWATAAGFQIGSLYREFYTVLLTTLPDFKKQAASNAKLAKISPRAAEKQLVQVYLEEVHGAVKPLLSKAMRVFEQNLLMADRVGVRSEWVGKSLNQLNELKHLLSLPPKEAIKLVSGADGYPEDQPAAKESGEDPQRSVSPPPEEQPGAPGEPETGGDEPGRVIL